jgi:hypothetical protein
VREVSVHRQEIPLTVPGAELSRDYGRSSILCEMYIAVFRTSGPVIFLLAVPISSTPVVYPMALHFNFYLEAVMSSVADPHHFDADPDQPFTLMWIRIRLFTLMRIRIRLIQILLHIKVMQVRDHWHTDLSRLHFKPPRLHFEPP